ncbi:MAG TPA: cytochrome c oxidase subunit II [Micromonosporaceae bacterium]
MVARGSGRDAATRSSRRRIGRAAALCVIAIASAVTLSGCSAKNAFALGWPWGGITTQSNEMYNLWIGTVIAAAVVGLVVYALIFWCVIRYRKRKGSDDTLPAQTRYNLPIELIYTVIPFLIIAVLFYYTARAETDVDKISAHPQVSVKVVAFKWNWEFQYLNGDAKMPDGSPVTEIGNSSYVPILVLPTDKTIEFTETSEDVIHSFWVPELLFKRDVFPGNLVNHFQVTIVKTGAYVGRCAELCGTYHSQMNFELYAVTPANYATYLADRQAGMSTPQALVAIGYTQNNGYATTTQPFNTSRTANTATP